MRLSFPLKISFTIIRQKLAPIQLSSFYLWFNLPYCISTLWRWKVYVEQWPNISITRANGFWYEYFNGKCFILSIITSECLQSSCYKKNSCENLKNRIDFFLRLFLITMNHFDRTLIIFSFNTINLPIKSHTFKQSV